MNEGLELTEENLEKAIIEINEKFPGMKQPNHIAYYPDGTFKFIYKEKKDV